MKPTKVSSSEDYVSLQMENDLLAYEVDHLRARLAAADRLHKHQLDAQKRQLQQRAKRAGSVGGRDAVSDMRWLLGRLDASAAGFALRRNPTFRMLLSVYLDERDKA